MRRLIVWSCLSFLLVSAGSASAQLLKRETEYLTLVYYDVSHEYLTFHLARSFENSLNFHRKLFDYTPSEPVVTLFQDFGDYGHGGTSTVPWNYFNIGIEPFDYVYDTMPANERMNWLMHHELVHVVATDKAAGRDLTFRRLFHGKVAPEQENPLSMFYSYLTSPRWYAPRWYHEGIAVFLETWMAGGVGRGLGGYDEMVFRTMALENAYFYDLVGLESEGKTIDFQVGQNSYLYGTRFILYLADKHGPDKVLQWFNRSSGSEPYFSKQFTKVFGTPLDDEWRLWIAWEKGWQAENLSRIRSFPTPIERNVTSAPLGSVSRPFLDTTTGELLVAVNHPGKPPRIVAIDPASGKSRNITDVSGPALYYVTSLAYDAKGKRLFFTGDNSHGWRDIEMVELTTGVRRMLLKDTRVGDLVINPADQSLWGVRHNNGLSVLVRIPPPYDKVTGVLTLDYGRDIFDLDITPDGATLSFSMSDVTGRQQLAIAPTANLLAGDSAFKVIHEFKDNSVSNFVFSPDGRFLYGTTYYTGVSNIFRYDLGQEKMEAVTNAETGYFRPLPISPERLIAFRFTSNGLQPVELPITPIDDINPVQYLGQKTVNDHPELTSWMAGSPGDVNLDTVTTGAGSYDPLREMRFASVFPVMEGYKDSPVAGVRFNFADPLALRTVKVTGSVTVDESVSDDERFHLMVDYSGLPWSAQLRYNATDFYDLFGPTKTSRKGYSAELGYEHFLIFERPKTLEYSIDAAYWGGLDTLPDYQNIATSVETYGTVGARLDYANLRRTIGAVDAERGTEWSLRARLNYADSEYLPRLYGTFSKGVALPLAHSSLWLRGSAGKSFRGTEENPFAGFYFGAFGNNWVDYRSSQRYREYYSFPGMEINEVGGTDYGKAMVEWTLPPWRFRRFGNTGIYCNWARAALFTSGLVTNMDNPALRREVTNAGAQIDFSVVMFSNLESMISAGYAKAFEEGEDSDEFMISLRLLK
jgi:hypothetical protein